MGKTIYLFLFLFILLACSVSAEITLVTDTFSGTTLDNAIWASIVGNYNLSEGYLNITGNTTNPDNFEMRSINVFNSSNNGYIQIEMKTNDPYAINQKAYFGLTNRSVSGSWSSTPPTACGLIIDRREAGYVITHLYPTATLVKTINSGNSNWNTIKIVVTRYGTSSIFKVYFNNVLEYTENQTTNCAAKALTAQVGWGSSSGLEHKAYYDNFEMTLSDSLNQTGAPCNKDSDCVSGSCDYGFCALKAGRESCTDDGQCLSGSCLNNVCTNAELWDSLEYSKSQIFGNSVETNNFISLFLILGVSVMIATSGGIWVGMGWIVLSTIFFTIVGWLSPFFLIGIFLIGLIIMVLGVTIGSKG